MSFEDMQERLEAARSGDTDDNTTEHDNTDDVTEHDDVTDDGGDDTEAEDNSSASLDESTGQESQEPKRKGILGKINDILNRKPKDDTDEDEDMSTDQDDEESQEGAEDSTDESQKESGNEDAAADNSFVDPRFMVIASEYGWTEQQIINYSSKNDASEVVKLANHMEEALGVADEDDQDGQESDTSLISEEVLAKLEEDEDNAPIINDVVKPLLKQVQGLSEALAAVQGKDEVRDEEANRTQAIEDYNFANDEFDRHSDTFEMLGKTDNLRRLSDGSLDTTDPAVQLRSEVYQRASMYRQMNPKSTRKEAMDDAMIWFRGKHGEAKVKKEVLTKIKKSASRVSPKSRGSNKTRKFTNERDRRRAVINGALEKHGTKMR